MINRVAHHENFDNKSQNIPNQFKLIFTKIFNLYLSNLAIL